MAMTTDLRIKVALWAVLLALLTIACRSTSPDIDRLIARIDTTPTARQSQADARLHWENARRAPVGPWKPDRERVRRKLAALPRFSSRTGQWNPDKSTQKSGDWEFLGPGNVGGRTRALVIDPIEQRVMYAGGVTGGIWKSTDAGSSWVPKTDQLGNINIAVLAMDPSDPSTLYAGTGEIYVSVDRPYSQFTGDGILVSRDAGENWSQLPATDNLDFQFVTDLIVSPGDSQRLYAATNSGVWRSGDGGESWQQSLRPLDIQGRLLINGCNDLAVINGGGGEILLSSCGSRTRNNRYHVDSLFVYECPGDCEGRVYRNENPDADDWQVVLSETNMGRIEIAAAPSDPDMAYAVGASLVPGPDRDGDGEGDYLNTLHAVFRSTDAGLTWQARIRNTTGNKNQSLLLSDSVSANLVECGFDSENTFRGQAWYDLVIAVNPVDANVVWVGGIDMYRSDDGGLSWGQASYWWLDPEDPDNRIRQRLLHADQHDIVFHPNFGGFLNGGTMFVVNDGGVWKTQVAQLDTATSPIAPCNPLEDFVTWESLNNGYGVTQFYHGQALSDGTRYYGGTQDNGTILGDDSSGTEGWIRIQGGDGAYNAAHPTDPDILYASRQGVAISKSTDGGETFVDVSQSIDDSGLFIMPYIIDPNDGDNLYTGGTRLWRTTNGAITWVQASQDLGEEFDDTISALALAPSNSNRLYFGNRNGIFRNDAAQSSNSSSTFPMTTPRLGWVSSIAVDPTDPERAFASYSTVGGTHVWGTEDGGVNWLDNDGAGSGRLPDVPVHSLVVNPLNPQVLYAGTDLGVFVSTNEGYTWAEELTGFSRVVTEFLQYIRPPNVSPQLFAFTHGRGVWRVTPATLGTPSPASTRTIDSSTSGLWFNPDQSGHGFVVETIDTPAGDQLLVYWFAFLDGQPVWIGGVGQLDRAVARIPVIIASGADFPPDFLADDVALQDWGSLTLSFTDDATAQVTWNSIIESFGNGSLDLVRLTRVLNNDDACVSGAWFNPDQNGHGFLVELTEIAGIPTLVVIWFVYVDSEQTWLIGTAPFAGGQALLEMERLSGGEFPPLFDPGQVTREDWGTLSFTHVGGDQAEVNWSSAVLGFSAGDLDLIRLSSLSGHACVN